MKKSDIYEIAIKILGVYLAISSVSIVGSLIIQLYAFFFGPGKISGEYGLLFGIAIFFAAYFRILYLLIFKTKIIIKKITVETDHEENAKLFAEKETILEIAFLIIGGITVVWSLPEIANKIFMLLSGSFKPNSYFGYFITSSLEFIFGLLVFLDAKPLAKYFAREKTQ